MQKENKVNTATYHRLRMQQLKIWWTRLLGPGTWPYRLQSSIASDKLPVLRLYCASNGGSE